MIFQTPTIGPLNTLMPLTKINSGNDCVLPSFSEATQTRDTKSIREGKDDLPAQDLMPQTCSRSLPQLILDQQR